MRGLLLRRDDQVLRQLARVRGLGVEISAEPRLPFDETLIASGMVPWSLVEVGWRALERWELAVPFSKGCELAESVGEEADRARTEEIVRDLRVPLYSLELMLIRRCAATERLMEVWRAESGVGDERLAFLRALYLTKPLVLALPRTWLSQVSVVSPQAREKPKGDNRLIHVPIAPGVTVCCRPEEAEMYRERFAAAARRR